MERPDEFAEDAALAELQAALLALLAEGRSPTETLARLRLDPAFAAHRDWVCAFEARTIEVATRLVRKWRR